MSDKMPWRERLEKMFFPFRWAQKENDRRLAEWHEQCRIARENNQPPPFPPNRIWMA
jgi:hypothetical protein